MMIKYDNICKVCNTVSAARMSNIVMLITYPLVSPKAMTKNK